MDLQRWMTRFQLTANRLSESWMDLVPDLDLTTPEVVATIAQRRVAHEEQQENLAGIAAATPGAVPHVNVPWNDEMSRQVNKTRRQQQRAAFPLSDNLSALIFCGSSRFDTGSKKFSDKYHDTSWKNTSLIQCARTQRSLFGDVLHNSNSSGQSNDATLWHGTEKIFPCSGRRRH